MHKLPGLTALTITMSLLACLIYTPVQCSAQSGSTVVLGPFLDKNEKPVLGVGILVSYGTDNRNATTDSNGTAHIFVPASWLNKTVTVRLSKDGYKDTTFTGYIGNNSVFTPTDGSYPNIEKSVAPATVDYSFVIIAFIVLIVLILVLVGMKGEPETKKKKVKFKDKEERKKGSEEE